METTALALIRIIVMAIFIGNLCVTQVIAGNPSPDPSPDPSPNPCVVDCGDEVNIIGIETETETETNVTLTGGDQELGQKQKMHQSQNQSIENSGNNTGNANVEITYRIPIELITPKMIEPIILDDEIFSHLQATKNIAIDGTQVIFVNGRNRLAIEFILSSGSINVLDTAQNHGKKFLATFHPRSGEYVGPIEQVREMLKDAPDGTKCVIVGVKTMTHTRGAAGVTSTGENSSNWTSAISGNIAGSTALPFIATTATFLDRKITIVNCNDPTEFENPLCRKENNKEGNKK